MKKLFLLFVTIISILSCSWENKAEAVVDATNQNRLDKYQLRKNVWHISKIIGEDINKNKELTLSKINDESQHSMYGMIIKFNLDNTYEDFYQAKCGNDCFPSSKGYYILKDGNRIDIKVKEFHQSGDCKELSISYDKNYVTYYIFKKSDGNLKLIRD